MKNLLMIILSVMVTIHSFSQQLPSDSISRKERLMLKSRNQKNGGTVLLIGGATLIGIGSIIAGKHDAEFSTLTTGATLIGIGAVSALGSIPLFLASGRNKRKANKLVASIQFQPYSAPYISCQKSFPAVAYTFNISTHRR